MEANLLALEGLLTAAASLVASMKENGREAERKAKKKAIYLEKKRLRKLSKGRPPKVPTVNAVVAPAPAPAPLPVPKPVVKRAKGSKVICELCKSAVCKSHLKRHQGTKKCKTKHLGLEALNEVVDMPISSGEITLNTEPTEDDLDAYFDEEGAYA